MILKGVDASELWGFLTAVGALHLAHEELRRSGKPAPTLHFQKDGCPVLMGLGNDRSQVAKVLFGGLKRVAPFFQKKLGKAMKPVDISPEIMVKIAGSSDRSESDALAGLSCFNGHEVIESSLCAANGAGHQNLIQSIRDVLDLVEAHHLANALFEPWTKKDTVSVDARTKFGLGNRKPTLRFDSGDERLYALRLENPTKADDFTTEFGAQALAIAALSIIPVLPGRDSICIASRRERHRVFFHWCLWTAPCTQVTVRSLLSLGVDKKEALQARGAFAAFRAARVSGAKGKLSFAPTEGLWSV